MKLVFNSIIIFIVFIQLLTSSSCSQVSQANEKSNNNESVDSLKQTKNELINGIVRAVCYSGFRSGQHPDRGSGAKNPSYEEVLEDLQILSKGNYFQLIRVYDSGENSKTVLKVIKENNLNIKVMLGIWLDAELSNHETCAWLTEPIPVDVLAANRLKNLKEIERGIELANRYPEIVVAVNVGNEALVEWNDHKVHPDTIITYVKTVKRAVKQQVTVADNYKWWAEHGAKLAKEVDFLAVHTYPVWEGKDIDEGLSYTIENLMEIKRAIPESKIVISEAGWVDVASEFGERASEEKQLRYYNELMNWAKEKNITIFFFEAFDEDWKGDPQNAMGAEKHWGLFSIDRKPKKVLQAQYSDLK